MKHLTILASFLSLSSIAALASLETPSTHFSGFNIGVQVGVGTGRSTMDRDYFTTSSRKDSVDLGMNGALAGLNLGYGLINQGWYYGLQAAFDITSLKGDVGTNVGGENRKETLKLRHTFSFNAKVGKVVNNALPYLKLGVATSKMKVETVDNARASLINTSSSKNRTAFVAGAGVDFLVTDRMSFGCEYTYFHYNTLKHTHTGTANYSVKPRVHTFTLNLRW